MSRTAIAVLGLCLALTGFPIEGVAQSDWRIDDFDVDVEIQADGGLIVTETITANFTVPKHGIFRFIPIVYDVALHRYALRFKLLDVTDGKAAEREVDVRRDGRNVHLQIGSSDRTVIGAQVYRIRYRVYRAILHQRDGARLIWNATGNEWGVPIAAATVTVTFPQPLDDTQVIYDAWTGAYGATGKDFVQQRVDDRTILFAVEALRPREGVTVEVTLPSGAVAAPGLIQRALWILGDNLAYVVLLIVLGGCVFAWRRFGRDPMGMGSIVVQYEPPKGLGPAEVGTIADETVHMRDITAAIIDLAVRGYIDIEEVSEKKFLFTKEDHLFHRKRPPDDLNTYERTLMKGLFDGEDSRALSDLERKFVETANDVKRDIYRRLTSSGYFDGNPEGVRSGFTVLGILAAAALLAGVGFLQKLTVGTVSVLPIVIAGALSLVTIIITGQIMPRKTMKGRLAWEKVKGLEEYLQRAERRELEEHERRGVFEQLLPHAIALGLVDRWASAFEGIYAEPPNWYAGRHDGTFTTVAFAHSLNNSVSRMNTALSSQPRSSGGSSGGFSGGGSSGGGFGGGGGGSW